MPLHPSEAVNKMINMLPITLNLKAVLQNANKPLPVPSVPRETKEQRNQLRPAPQLHKNGQNQDQNLKTKYHQKCIISFKIHKIRKI